MNIWNSVDPAPPDAILGLTEAYRSDKNPEKVNLGVGVFKDETGGTPILKSVAKAQQLLLERETTKSYLPIAGTPEYATEVQKLLFGQDSEVIDSGRAASVHTPGGTGALRLGAELLRKFRSGSNLWVSNPTWANHKGIFPAAGFNLKEYPYYDSATHLLDFEALYNALEKVPENDIVLLHACCHNPTGVDLSAEQWRKIANLAVERGWTPFLDFAYQGFGDGVVEDRLAIEVFAEKKIEFFVASSFSKNFGLYRERTGAFTVVACDAQAAQCGLGHLKKTARVIYSNPPAHGSMIATTILQDKVLREEWLAELSAMRERIKKMRSCLVSGLEKRNLGIDFSFVSKQKGMFSYSGLSPDQVNFLREKRSIYMVGSGRINISGLTEKNLDYVCDSIVESLA